MTFHLENISVDSSNPAKLAAFWASALDWGVVDDDDQDEVCVRAVAGSPGSGILPDLLFLRVPEGKTVKNRLHLDLRPDNQAAEVARLEGLGAQRVDIGQGTDVTWVVLADPEGNEFCVLRAL